MQLSLQLELPAPGIAPGRFVMVQIGEHLEPFLRRPFFIAGAADDTVALLVARRGRAGSWLAARHPGDAVSLLGPLGKGIAAASGVRNLLLAANGVDVAPLLLLAERTAAQRSITVLLGSTESEVGYPAALLPPEVEALSIAGGPDGQALADAVAEHAAWADQVVVAGSEALLARVASLLRSRLLRRTVTAMLITPLPCGTGVCNGCAVQTRRRGLRLACLDGPAFELRDLY